MLLYIMFIYIF